jgi:hypothetical protein
MEQLSVKWVLKIFWNVMSLVSRLPPKLVPLLARATSGGRRHRLSSCHRSTFLFPFVLSWLYTPGSHYVIIYSLFNPLVLTWFCSCLFFVSCSRLLWDGVFSLRGNVVVSFRVKYIFYSGLCPAPDSALTAAHWHFTNNTFSLSAHSALKAAASAVEYKVQAYQFL